MSPGTPTEPIRAEAPATPKAKSGKRSAPVSGWQLVGQDDQGWRLWEGAGNAVPTVRQFEPGQPPVGELNPKSKLTFLLPLRCVLLQFLELPTTNEEEIRSMAELQLEKADLAGSSGQLACEILNQRESSSEVLCLILQTRKIDAYYEPFTVNRRWPTYVHLQAEFYARMLPSEHRYLLLYRENQDLILAITARGRLEFAELLAAPEDGSLDGDAINQALWRAELNGHSTSFDQIAVGPGCEPWSHPLTDYFQAPTVALDVRWPLSAPLRDLSPASWQERERHAQRGQRYRKWLILGGAAYAILLVAAFAWLFYLGQQVSTAEARNERIQAKLIEQAEYEAKWNAWQGAVDPSASALTQLMTVFKALPNEETQLTSFLYTPEEIIIEGEAPSLKDANQTVRNIKKAFIEQGFDVSASMPASVSKTPEQTRYHFDTRVHSYSTTPPPL